MDFNQVPFIVIWETTQACDLSCVHCRAQAQPDPLPGELTYEEALDLIDQVAQMGTRVMVLSGGDPLKRTDLFELIQHGKSRGLRMGTIPAATPRLTLDKVKRLKDSRLDQMALSLDFSTEEPYDSFRGFSGAFAKVMEAVDWAHQVGLALQINTVMSARNFQDVDSIIELVQRLGIVFWEVFFLVPMGRGRAVFGLTATQYEEVFTKLYALSQHADFIVKVTEAMHYHRYVRQKVESADFCKTRTPHRSSPNSSLSIGVAPQTVNAGKGHCFVSSTGEVYPSGFLPIPTGNVRQHALAGLYRESSLFKILRDPELLKGRCGVCAFRHICGGSRARAYAMTGDYLEEDPCCAYVPTVLGCQGERERSLS